MNDHFFFATIDSETDARLFISDTLLEYIEAFASDTEVLRITLLGERISDCWGYSTALFDDYRCKRMSLNLEEMARIKKFLTTLAAALPQPASTNKGYTILTVD
jgi:hypothetical protein